MPYIASRNLSVNQEVDNILTVDKLENIYQFFDDALPVFEVQILNKEKVRVLRQIPDKELRKALEKQYKKLDIAIMFNDLATVKKIYALKTPVKRSSEYSFAYAVKTGNLNLVKFIFEQGEIDIESYYTKECLEIAAEEGFLDIVKYLIKIGLNPCDRQFYPLIWARKKGYEDIISFLEKDIKKRLGKLPDIKDPYEEILAKKQIETVNTETPVPVEEIEKPNGRGAIVSKIKPLPKSKKEVKKKVLSLEELKKRSKRILTSTKSNDKVKSEKKTKTPKKVVQKERKTK